MASFGLMAQTYVITEDLTASKLQNADFNADEPVTQLIRTYDYDMTDAGAGSGEEGAVALYGQQPVTGWIAANPTDNIKVSESSASPREDSPAVNQRAGGVFALQDDTSEEEIPGLGGAYYPPYQMGENAGKVLGYVAVWGATIRYYQEVELPAGAYMMIVNYQNTGGGTTASKSYNGFIAEDGTEYLSANKTYPVTSGNIDEWSEDTIVFQLAETTKGQISLGYNFGSGSGSAPHMFIDHVKLYSIDAKTLEQQKIDEAKAELLKVIEIGTAYGVDTSKSKAVYDNAKATLDEVLAAIEEQKAINETGITDLSEYFITNPHFSIDDPIDNGSCTYDYDMEKNGTTYFGSQPITGWTTYRESNNILGDRNRIENGRASGVYAIGDSTWLGAKAFLPPTTMSDGSNEGKVLGFVTCWSLTVQYTQPVVLPAGQYTLSISYFNSGGSQAVARNLMGFVADNGDEHYFTRTQFPVGSWVKESIEFTLDEETSGYFSLGYAATNTGSGNMPHFFVDGFFLSYIGTGFDPSLFALRAAIASGQKLLNETFNEDMKDKLQAAVDAAQELSDADSKDQDANREATTAISSMIADVNANIDAYIRLQEFYDVTLNDKMEEYNESFPALYDRLGLLQDEIMEALSDYNWTTAQINEAIASLDGIIREETQKAWDEAVESGEKLDENFDITLLFDQMAYTYSTSAVSNTSIPDKEWQYGSASNFKTQYGTAEVWNQSPFTVSRTLTNMPAGTYTITTKAFYRVADNATNYTAYNGEEELPNAYVFAGSSKTPIVNVAELATNADNAVTGATEITIDDEGNTLFVPNSQAGAYEVFNSENYAEVVTRSVSTVLVEPGDLTFGVKTDEALQGNSWVIWYGFTISYNAIDQQVLSDELTTIVADLKAYVEENEENFMTNPVIESSKNVLAEAEAVDHNDVEAMSAAEVKVNEALAAAKANVALMTTAGSAIDSFYEAVESATDASQTALAAAAELIDKADGVKDMSEDDIRTMIDDMTLVKAMLNNPEYTGATDDNPIDFTVRVVNNSFETGDTSGWTYNTRASGDTGARDNTNATYTVENADGAYVFNTWNSSAVEEGFWLAQEIVGLPAGTYQLDALLASYLGNTITISAANGSKDYTMENDKEVAAEASIIFTVAEGESVTIKVASETWFKADNFILTYFGTESSKEPTVGIEAIEGTANAKSVDGKSIYNLNGQRLAAPQKGINIIGGKKVLVK